MHQKPTKEDNFHRVLEEQEGERGDHINNHHDHLDDHQLEAQQITTSSSSGTSAHPTHRSLFRPSFPRRTSPLVWATAVLCALLWSLVILGGLAVLVVYLLFRPRTPRFDISSATLNGAYLDSGALLNADLTILANFSNPNRRLDVFFRYVAVDVFFGGTLIATQGVAPFGERAGESALRSLHMVSSEVALLRDQVDAWRREVGGGDGVEMEIRGSFLTTSYFVGTFLRIPYSLHGNCKIAVGGPPGGVLRSSNCTTKGRFIIK